MSTLEDIYNKVNNRKVPRFQCMAMFILSFATISMGGLPLFLTLLSTNKYWKCQSDACDQTKKLCDQKISKYDWTSTLASAPESFVKDFDIWCNSTGVITAVSSLFFVGMMFGTTLGGMLSDAIGRKKSGAISLLCTCLMIVLHMVSKSDFRVFGAAHVISGFCSGGAGAIIFTYQSELVICRLRNISTQLNMVGFSLGILYGTVLSAYVSSWRIICLLLPIPSVFFITIVLIWLPESPFWLYSQGKSEEVTRVLTKIAAINGVKYIRDDRIDQPSYDVPEQRSSVLTVFTSSFSTCRTACILLFCWLTTSFCYWGLSFNVGSLYGNIFQNQLLICALDFINRPINWLLLVYMNRKPFFACCNGAMCLSAVICLVPYEQELFPGFTLKKISALVGRMVADQYFSTIYLYTVEVYPTPFRSSGLGMSSSAARIGSFVSPFVIVANTYSDKIIFSVILVLSFAGLVLFHWLPETKDKNLPENLYDMRKLIEGKSNREEALFELLQYNTDDDEDEIYSRS